MKLIKRIFNKFNGLHFPQEYLCLAKETFDQSLYVYLVSNGRVISDITDNHIFVGYNPLIFALAGDKTGLPAPAIIDLAFTEYSRLPNEFLEKKDAIASLRLKMIRQQKVDERNILYYEGVEGQHHFISRFHQLVIALDNRLTNKRTGNVFLRDNLYKQVQIAYALPRVISVVTVGHGGLFNLFPTDLHGPLNDQYYVSSLRIGGKACQQVLDAGNLVISTVHCNAFKSVYSLGKNHMQDPSAKEKLPFGEGHSEQLGLPLSQAALKYRELEVVAHFDRGIHKIFLYKIRSEKTVQDQPATLAHIHNVYATWRHSKGLSGNYLLR